MLQRILSAYNINPDSCTIQPFGSGLINHTWKVETNAKEVYILQRINQSVFMLPSAIAHNIKAIADYLQVHHPGYMFVTPIKTKTGGEMMEDREGYFRLLPFVQHSHSKNVLDTSLQAYEAARQFGQFTKLLTQFDTTTLNITLKDFHNLSVRYSQFLQSLTNGNQERIRQSGELISLLIDYAYLVETFESIQTKALCKIRVIHHDTKISNVLFNDNDQGLCVIDLDTVMPGYFISDVGDMMRTYLSPANEEERDFSKIVIREDYFKAIVKGYLSEMDEELSNAEKSLFVYSGEFIIYMQALRFLTDHLNNDTYYGARYEGHNFIRAKNQIVLLQKLMEKRNTFNELVMQYACKNKEVTSKQTELL